ncbi:Uma2 family endonuclease [Synechocystis sp. LEGE 06083]|uniref:Uma2 family endonuclease n=1 Tax=Synechocystis sp. LEGE 06083 TaxID=915336 RepID=UPI00187F669C|nr:Uma2 family endonuclease [Synechocystis sp. LEGE 06083]MBE9195875.1 Uma2 family endonuclease [Synechocystis sp. LEGE 06083]
MYQTASQFEAQMPNAKLLLSDEPEMESSLHSDQLMLLVACLDWLWRDRQDYFIGANLTIYFSRQQLKNRDFRGPDFFLIKGVEKTPRPSWVVWEEDGQYPNLIIELLSSSTASTDPSLKKQLYQDRFRTPEYFWFSPDTLEFEGFRLVGHRYEPIPLTGTGQRWSEELELFMGIKNGQLRYFFPDGALVPTPQEAAETAQQLLQQEKSRADRLANYLISQGIDPDRLGDD